MVTPTVANLCEGEARIFWGGVFFFNLFWVGGLGGAHFLGMGWGGGGVGIFFEVLSLQTQQGNRVGASKL